MRNRILAFCLLSCASVSVLSQESQDSILIKRLFFEDDSLSCTAGKQIKVRKARHFASDTTRWSNSTFEGRVRPTSRIEAKMKLKTSTSVISSQIHIDSSYYLETRNQAWGDSLTDEFIDTASYESIEAAAEMYTNKKGYELSENRIYIQSFDSRGKNKISYLLKTRTGIYLLTVKLKRKNRRDILVSRESVFSKFLQSFLFNVEHLDKENMIRHSIRHSSW